MEKRTLSPEEIREAAEHHDIVMALRAVLETKPGRDVIKYLLKSFDVGEVSPLGLEGILLHDRLGMMRAGNSIFKISCEAHAEKTAYLLAEIEKERYDLIYKEAQIGT